MGSSNWRRYLFLVAADCALKYRTFRGSRNNKINLRNTEVILCNCRQSAGLTWIIFKSTPAIIEIVVSHPAPPVGLEKWLIRQVPWQSPDGDVHVWHAHECAGTKRTPAAPELGPKELFRVDSTFDPFRPVRKSGHPVKNRGFQVIKIEL
jgi:hypothetical protein